MSAYQSRDSLTDAARLPDFWFEIRFSRDEQADWYVYIVDAAAAAAAAAAFAVFFVFINISPAQHRSATRWVGTASCSGETYNW